MLTVLGIIATCGALFFGISLSSVKMKGVKSDWVLPAIAFSLVAASLGCLSIAFLCFGGTF